MAINSDKYIAVISDNPGILIPLKFKYRDVSAKGPKGQPSKGVAGVKKAHKTQGWGPRRRAYGPFNTF